MYKNKNLGAFSSSLFSCKTCLVWSQGVQISKSRYLYLSYLLLHLLQPPLIHKNPKPSFPSENLQKTSPYFGVHKFLDHSFPLLHPISTSHLGRIKPIHKPGQAEPYPAPTSSFLPLKPYLNLTPAHLQP